MAYQKTTALALIFVCLCTTLPVSTSVIAASEKGAELSVIPVGLIPLIPPNEETFITLRYTDNFGMNWTMLQYIYGDTGIQAVLSFFITRVWWPIIHPTWRPFLGYTSVRFSAEVVGNHPGWSVSINPSTIAQSTDGTTADLQLSVFLNDLTAENTVTIRIAATRILKDGVTEYGTSYFEIPVRPKKLNYIDIRPDSEVKEVTPDSMVTFEIDITNRGYFVDTFAATVVSDSEIRAMLSEQSFVLQPMETRRVSLQVITPDIFFDPGTVHTIEIQAYSVNYPEYTYTGQVQVRIKGVFISPLVWIVLGFIAGIAVVIFLLYYHFILRRTRQLYGGKPDKPWRIPEEQKYLEQLKAKDRQKYETTLQMMNQEYESALLWYKDHCQSIKQAKKKRFRTKKSSVDKNDEPKQVKTTQENNKKIKEKTTRLDRTESKKEKQIIQADESEQRKQQALRRIQQEQEKQKKK